MLRTTFVFLDISNMNKKYSGEKINKTGKTLVSLTPTPSDPVFIECMDVLTYCRKTHDYPLQNAFSILQKIVLQEDRNAIFAKRLKRHHSIVNKLKRFKHSQLNNMQDIGGCRAILSSNKKITKIVRALKQRPEFRNPDGTVRRFDDYLTTPKDDGYRSYHLIGRFPSLDGKHRPIEIQLRTKLQHDWATTLEIVDLFTGQSLKSNQGSDEWKEFFRNVSTHFAEMEDIPVFQTLENQKKVEAYQKHVNSKPKSIALVKRTKRIATNLGVIRKLEAYYNSLKIMEKHLNEQHLEGYVLVEVNTSARQVRSSFFTDSSLANKAYTDAETAYIGKDDMVVALVSTTSIGGIKNAYPNFFADSTEFLKYFMIVMEHGQQESFDEKFLLFLRQMKSRMFG